MRFPQIIKNSRWTERTVHHPEIGPVLFKRSARARRMRLTVRQEGRVQLTLPQEISPEEAGQFLESKIGWVRKHLKQIRERQSRQTRPKLGEEEFIEAQHRMFHRLEDLAAEHGFRFGRVTIRCQKTRWASCSGRNNINLNVNLIFLPDRLLDYVLLHELVHTLHKNHGPLFWSTLDKLCGGKARALQKELRSHSMQIY